MIAGEARMSPAERIAEIEWFLECDVHPEQISMALGLSLRAIEKFLRDQERPDLNAHFLSLAAKERERRSSPEALRLKKDKRNARRQLERDTRRARRAA